MVTHQTNRTFICSTVFVDLVEYSRKSVSEQLALKDRFTALLAEALEGVDVNERIVLDTGDGAAMSFLGDPETALAVGMSLRRAFKDAEATDPGRLAPIRIGINLGPVKLVKDINGHPNIVGDGINVAQRIMSFAESGQILVSRSYHDVVSRLSEDYAALFKFEGSRTDKHVRDHEVYAVAESDIALARAKGGLKQAAAAAADKPAAAAPAGGTGPQRAVLAASAFLHDRRKVGIAGGVLAALIVALSVALAVRKPAPKPVDSAAAPAAAAEQPPPAKAADEAKKAEAPKPAAEAPKAVASSTAPAKAAGTVAAVKPGPAKAAGGTGTVHLAVLPWGEVFVNGRSRGVSPPLKTLKLTPGTYTIEMRNTTFPPGKQQIQVKAREEITVTHVFK